MVWEPLACGHRLRPRTRGAPKGCGDSQEQRSEEGDTASKTGKGPAGGGNWKLRRWCVQAEDVS